MRNLLIITLLLFVSSCVAQTPMFKVVNGVQVPLTQSEKTDIQNEWNLANQQRVKDSATEAGNKALFNAVKTTAQSAVGIKYDALSITQIRALFAFSLFKDGAIDSVGKIRPLKDWVK